MNIDFKGVIFDCDGVLLNSMGIWKDLGVRYVKSFGLTPEPDLQVKLFSMSMEQGVEYVIEHYPINKSTEEVTKDLYSIINDYYFYEVLSKTGAMEFLSLLKSKEIPMVVLTSSPRSHVEAALKRNGLLEFFDKVLTTTEIGESKHNPVVFDVASKELGFDKKDILVAEDSLYALETASNSGFKTMGVFDEEGESNQAGLKAKADLYVKDLMEAYLAYR